MKKKFVLGRAEVEVLNVLRSAMTSEEIVNSFLSRRVVTSKSSAEKAIKSLTEKGLTKVSGKKVKLTDAGKMQRSVLVMIGLLTE